MSETEIIEAPVPATEVGEWTPRIVITIDDAVAQVRQRDEFMAKVMRKDHDYGVIPGTREKPTLLKPGAERLLAAYGLHPELADEMLPTLDLTGEDHGGEPFFQFRRVCRVWRQTGIGKDDRMLVAQASGECNSWEKKYRYREGSSVVCPNCKQPGIRFYSDAQFIEGGQGWYHGKKGGGCGATIPAGYPRADELEAQRSKANERVPNPDPADQLNTMLKMADKRALVAAAIIATAWSDMVTQDLEDKVDSTTPEGPVVEAEGSGPGRGRTAGKRRSDSRTAPSAEPRGRAAPGPQAKGGDADSGPMASSSNGATEPVAVGATASPAQDNHGPRLGDPCALCDARGVVSRFAGTISDMRCSAAGHTLADFDFRPPTPLPTESSSASAGGGSNGNAEKLAKLIGEAVRDARISASDLCKAITMGRTELVAQLTPDEAIAAVERAGEIQRVEARLVVEAGRVPRFAETDKVFLADSIIERVLYLKRLDADAVREVMQSHGWTPGTNVTLWVQGRERPDMVKISRAVSGVTAQVLKARKEVSQ
jgi:hypothetical protein